MCTACGFNALAYGPAASSSAEGGSAGNFDAPNFGGGGGNTSVSQGATSNTNINGVLSGVKWSGSTLTFSFPTVTTQYESGYGTELTNNFMAAPEATKVAVRYAMNLISQYTNLVTSEISASTTADIRVAFSDAANPTAYAYYPSNSTAGGDVWYGSNYSSYQNPIKGQYAWATTIHELGHALGLKHGHETGGVANTAMESAFDQMAYSIMTYKSYANGPTTGYTNETNGYAQTFMMYDIAALQTMYGANFNTNSGDTTYRWDPNTGEMFINGAGQGAPGGNRIFMTLWDGNGTDTYDFSNYATNLNVNLSPGAFSITSSTQLAYLGSSHYAPGNIFNALQYNGDARSLIENAIGGSGNDSITGNDANNSLWGGNGSDTLYGLAGDDSLYGGAGDDLLVGGGGSDRMYGEAGVDRIFGEDGNDFLYGFGERDELYGQNGADLLDGGDGDDYLSGGADNDSLYGGNGADEMNGDSGEDLIYGGAGNDIIRGGFDNDRIYGEGDNDTIWGQDGNDLIDGGDGNDTLYGEAGDDTMYGGAGNDYLGGFAGSDHLYGDDGADFIDGGEDVDFLFGGFGDDTILGGFGNDELWGLGDNDTLAGQDGNDLIVGGGGNDNLYGEAGNDREFGEDGNDNVWGFAGNDELYGQNGNDNVNGGDGDDLINGGAGTDMLIGGIGSDRFVFDAALGPSNVDTIADYQLGQDRIELSSSIFNALSAGSLSASAFANGTAATTAAQHIIYDQTTGNLFYDADGNGAGAAVQFATLTNKPVLTTADFLIF
jgi:serralysin